MNIQELARAQKIYRQIEDIDHQIIGLDKLAKRIAGGAVASFDFSVMENNQLTPVKNEDGFSCAQSDRIGGPTSVEQVMSRMGISYPYLMVTPQKQEPAFQIAGQVSETFAMKLLSVFLSDLVDRKERLILKLKNCGVEV